MVGTGAEPVGRSAVRCGFFYLTGCDGTGKSTQAALLHDRLRLYGMRPCRRWLRFPFLISIPPLFYARLRGHSWTEKCQGVTHGYWDFKSSWLLRHCLPWTLLVDAALAAVIRIYLPLWLGRSVVCERFVLDMLIDLEVAFDEPLLHTRLPGRLFPLLIPPDRIMLMLDLAHDTILQRRPSLRWDRHLEIRLAAFRRLSQHFGLPVISSHLPRQQVAAQIWERARHIVVS